MRFSMLCDDICKPTIPVRKVLAIRFFVMDYSTYPWTCGGAEPGPEKLFSGVGSKRQL